MIARANDPILLGAIQRFKRGAVVIDFGCLDEDSDMERAGWKSVQSAVNVLDALGEDARRSLVPLLDDPNPAIRVIAAGYLVRVIPDKALATLKEIDATSDAEAGMTAYRLLRRHERGKPDL